MNACAGTVGVAGVRAGAGWVVVGGAVGAGASGAVVNVRSAPTAATVPSRSASAR
ncbi:MAG TPA: hypothetical protein VNT55_24705 [Baekduia sp.]|nr:hypothetical protein [Baekduia sp.]